MRCTFLPTWSRRPPRLSGARAAPAPALSLSGYTRPGLVALEAHSAGGLTAGALLNRRTADLGAVLLEAPFVDVLSAMCQPALPLTVHEYDEWGDPSLAEQQEQAGAGNRGPAGVLPELHAWDAALAGTALLLSRASSVSLHPDANLSMFGPSLALVLPCRSGRCAHTRTCVPRLRTRPRCSRAARATCGCPSGGHSSMRLACAAQQRLLRHNK